MSSIRSLPVDINIPLTRSEQYRNWTTSDVRRRLDDLSPNGIIEGVELWSATVPLICFEAMEWHPTDRVKRQFGFCQDPPEEAINLGTSHNVVLTGPKDKN
ncbi:hypothetical protein Ahy_B09g098705 [Arachis hypogaea]|uniref:Aminotransferase-like plant mobile domain-containing protein n=1 Tax=Arachis hypogaea TaxID=3818 RepID=A0A444XRV0_ARAHY|nr:hypothetical protein Ahy_B09g098705 [Arachis hypogaea]